MKRQKNILKELMIGKNQMCQPIFGTGIKNNRQQSGKPGCGHEVQHESLCRL